MKHNSGTHRFGRGSGAKKALIRGLVISLVEHERIKTTLIKAKEARRHVEKAITSGKQADLNARRLLMSRFPHAETVQKIVDDLAVRFKSRPGGYTRVIKLGTRPGDNAPMAYLEFVDYKLPTAAAETVKGDKTAKTKSKKATKSAVKTKKKARSKQTTARKKSRK